MVRNFLFSFFFVLCLASCDDGDIEFETIDFSSSKVSSCVNDTTTTFLYKVQGKQALILTLPKDALQNKVDTLTGIIPTQYKLLFRSFDGNVSNNYFCHDLPPANPKVVSQIAAMGGTVSIITIEQKEKTDTKKYHHLISIKDLVLINSKGEKLIDSKFDFGTFITQKEE